VDIQSCVDYDWAEDVDRRRSTNGYVFQVFGGVMSWMSKQQGLVALSTREAKYMAATCAYKEAIWLMKLCSDVGISQRAITVQCDSNSDICLEKNPNFHAQTKHIEIQYHFVQDMVEDGKVILEKVDNLQNVVDALKKLMSTKSLGGVMNLWAS
jgi:hypothetical protein